MGNAQPKPEVDLLPPRFARKVDPLEKLPLAILETAFGQEKRDRLFTDHFANAGTISVAGSFRPDYEEKAKVGLAVNVAKSPKASVAQKNDAQLSLGYTSKGNVAQDGTELPDYMFGARLGTDGSVRAVAAALDPNRGFGAYATFPLDYFIERQQRQQIGSMEDNETLIAEARATGIGYGLGGRSTRFNGLKANNPVSYPAAVAAVSLGATVPEVVSPRTVTPAPAVSAAGDVVTTGTAATCLSPALPEVGLRYLDREDRFAVGVHAAPVQPYPVKLWALGALGEGDVKVGMQLSSDVFRAFPSVQQALAASSAASRVGPSSLAHATLPADAVNPAGTPLAGSSKAGSLSSISNRYDLGAAISISQAPLYELSLAYDGANKEVVAGFLYNQVLRRRVYNPIEDDSVKGIWNYLDLGVELRRPLVANMQQAGGAPASFAVASAWQLNRNWMIKGRVGTNDISASLVAKNWWSTAFTGCVTASFDRRTYTSGVGFFISAERGGALDYQKAVEGAQTTATHMALKASPGLNERVSRTIDQQAVLPPPVSRSSGKGGKDSSSIPAEAVIAATGRTPRYAGEYDAVKKGLGRDRESKLL
jgi:hypothetical protein